MKTELNPEDRQRIEQEAEKYSAKINHHYACAEYCSLDYKAGAEYEHKYQREFFRDKVIELQADVDARDAMRKVLNDEKKEQSEQIKKLEAERSELIEKMTELLKAFNDSDKNYADWVATKELYSAFTGVNNLLERLNSLKTK